MRADDRSRAWRPSRRARRAPSRSRRRRWCGRRTSGSRSRGWWSCAPSSRRSRSTATLTLQNGQRYTHALLEHHGVLVRPELLTRARRRGRRLDRHRPRAVHDPRRDRQRARPPQSAASASARACSSTAHDLPSTGLLAFGSRAHRQVMLRVRRGAASSRWSRRCATRLQGPTSSTSARSAAPRTRSARTSIAPRTT